MTSLIWADVPTALIGSGPGSAGGTNGFQLLRGFKSYDRSTIMRKPILWEQVVIAMDRPLLIYWKTFDK